MANNEITWEDMEEDTELQELINDISGMSQVLDELEE